MNILIVIVMGITMGFFATKVIEAHGLTAVGDAVLGILGAFIGTLLYSNMGGRHHHPYMAALGTSVAGATLFLIPVFIFSALFGHLHAKELAQRNGQTL